MMICLKQTSYVVIDILFSVHIVSMDVQNCKLKNFAISTKFTLKHDILTFVSENWTIWYL